MERSDIEKKVLAALRKAAPDANLKGLNPDLNFRDQIEIDSLDFLNFVLLVEKSLGCSIPESDYPKLSSLAGCVRYFASRSKATRR